MTMLTPTSLPTLQAALGEAGLDGWLLYDFRGLNPVATALTGFVVEPQSIARQSG